MTQSIPMGTRERPYEVWGVTLHAHMIFPGDLRAIVACKSRASAARLLGVTDHFLKEYGTPTGNPTELATATAQPGVVFVRPLNEYHGNFVAAILKGYHLVPKEEK